MTDLFVVIWVLFFLFFFASLLWQLYRWNILSNPSNRRILSLVHEDLQKYLDPSVSSFIDLGCGLGTSLWFFHQRGWFDLKGIEGFTPVWLIGKLLKQVLGYSRLELRKGDYRNHKIEADVLFAYISPSAMKEMSVWIAHKKPSFEWLVAHTFSLPGYTPHHTLRADDLYNSPIYFYKRSQMFDQPKA